MDETQHLKSVAIPEGPQTIDVVCVEDHEPDAILIRRACEGSPHMNLGQFYRTTDLKSFESLQQEREFDVVLLDLGLPDSQGLETIARARAIRPLASLVVLTGADALGVECICAGADDFVAKDDIGNGHLARTLAHVVERQRLKLLLAKRENEQELERIRSVRGHRMPVASALVGSHTLAESDPGFSLHCEQTFARLVFERLTTTSPQGESDPGQVMRTLSRQMASRQAGPEDVVSVMTSAVEGKRGQLRPAQFGPYVREARLALIELMGHLLGHYRAHLPLYSVDDVETAPAPKEAVLELLPVSVGSGAGAVDGS